MAGRNLGEAFVVIYPEASQFLTELSAKITAAVKAFKAPAVQVSADTGPALAQMQLLVARMKAMADTLAKLRLDADDKALQAKIAGVEARLIALGKQMGNLVLNADTSVLNAKIAAEIANLQSLRRQLSDLQVNADTTKASLKILLLQRQVAAYEKQLEDPEADIDTALVTAKLNAAEAQLALLGSNAKALELAAKTASFDAAIAASEAMIADLKRQAAEVQIGGDPAKIAAFTAAVMALDAATAKLIPDTTNLTAAGTLLAGAWSAVNARLSITPSWLNPTMAGFSGLHLLLDGLVEATIIAVSSLLALAAGAAVAAPAIDQVGYNTEHALEAMTALGTDAGPLAGKLDAVQKAMAPQVIEAYGGALSILTGQTGALAKVGAEVVTGFDDMIARVDIWMSTQKDMGGLLQSGVGFLTQMAKILGTLAMAIDNLLTKDPGIAKMLLQVVQYVADAVNWFSQLPGPIVEAALAIHGIYLWGSLLLGVLLKMGGAVADAVKGFAALSVNPLFWVAAAAVAIGVLAYETTQASGATKGLITQQESVLSSMSASQAATTGLAAAIGALRAQMNDTSGLLSNEQQSWGNLGNTFRSAGLDGKAALDNLGSGLKEVFYNSNITDGIKKLATGIKDLFVPGGGQQDAVANDVAKLNSELTKLTGSYTTLYGETGLLMKSGYSLAESFALMDMAGVKWNDSAALMAQKVSNLIRGFDDMSVGGGLLNNTINAMNFATEQQDSKITQLNSAWDTFFKTVSGGATGFDAFATQSEGLYASMSQGSDKLTVSNGKASISLQATTAAAAAGAPSITGLATADLQLRDSFVQTAGAANTQLDNLTLMASAAGLGAKGTVMLTQASKDMVAQMLPAAKGSQEMTAILYTLAQRGGYQGADSFQALAKWVGNTKDPMASLDKITSQLTVDSANLITDVKNLSVALGTTLNSAMATAILTASGGQQVFDNFAKAVLTTSADSAQTQTAAGKLATQLYELTGNTGDAQSEFMAFAQKGLHLTAAQANTLWQQSLPQLAKATGSAQAAAQAAQVRFEQWAGKSGGTGLGLTTAQADVLWQKLSTQLGPEINDKLAQSVLLTQAKFEQWAGKGGASGLGLTTAQADALYKQLTTLQGYINTMHGATVTVLLQVGGTGNITFNESTGVGSDVTGGLKFMARGGQLPGFGGGDRIPAMLEPGEAVVDKDRTRKYAGVFRAMGVPGFAAGGLAGTPGTAAQISAALGSAQNWAGGVETGFGQAVESAFAKAVIAGFNAAQQAAKAAAISGGISGAGVSNASAEMALASAANKMGWGGSQWTALFDVEMREAGFNLTATNPTSGAYGMAQFINGPSEYAQYGGNANTAAGQAVAMVNYIAQRYGSPQAAWAHELQYGWYNRGGLVADQGTVLRPGWNMRYNATGRDEPLVPARGGGGRHASLDDVHQALLALIEVTGQQGHRLAGALNSTSAAAGARGSYSTRR